MSNPVLQWLPAFDKMSLFTPQECKLIIAAADAQGYTPGVKIGNDGVPVVDHNFRTNDNSIFSAEHAIFNMAVLRVQERMGRINRRFQFDLHPEGFRLVETVNVNRYDGEGDLKGKLDVHSDLLRHEGMQERKLSVVVLLNDPSEFEGGDLIVNDGIELSAFKNAKVGDAVLFPVWRLHAVKPVTKGRRYTMVMWLRGPRFR